MKLKNLYNQIREKNNDESMNSRPINLDEVKQKFNEQIGQFKKHGDILYNMGKYKQIAEYFKQLAENAENYLISESEDWFDNITIKRNIKEMKSYASDFAKVSSEAQALQERMAALYEDMGVILNRYFDIPDEQLSGQMPPQKNTKAMDISQQKPNPAKKNLARRGIRTENVGGSRSIREIASDIAKNWKDIPFAAKRDLKDMMKLDGLDSISSNLDSGDTIVRSFLSNSFAWKGPIADKIREELKSMLSNWYRTN